MLKKTCLVLLAFLVVGCQKYHGPSVSSNLRLSTKKTINYWLENDFLINPNKYPSFSYDDGIIMLESDFSFFVDEEKEIKGDYSMHVLNGEIEGKFSFKEKDYSFSDCRQIDATFRYDNYYDVEKKEWWKSGDVYLELPTGTGVFNISEELDLNRHERATGYRETIKFGIIGAVKKSIEEKIKPVEDYCSHLSTAIIETFAEEK